MKVSLASADRVCVKPSSSPDTLRHLAPTSPTSTTRPRVRRGSAGSGAGSAKNGSSANSAVTGCETGIVNSVSAGERGRRWTILAPPSGHAVCQGGRARAPRGRCGHGTRSGSVVPTYDVVGGEELEDQHRREGQDDADGTTREDTPELGALPEAGGEGGRGGKATHAAPARVRARGRVRRDVLDGQFFKLDAMRTPPHTHTHPHTWRLRLVVANFQSPCRGGGRGAE